LFLKFRWDNNPTLGCRATSVLRRESRRLTKQAVTFPTSFCDSLHQPCWRQLRLTELLYRSFASIWKRKVKEVLPSTIKPRSVRRIDGEGIHRDSDEWDQTWVAGRAARLFLVCNSFYLGVWTNRWRL
jgi:hypothetical protein